MNLRAALTGRPAEGSAIRKAACRAALSSRHCRFKAVSLRKNSRIPAVNVGLGHAPARPKERSLYSPPAGRNGPTSERASSTCTETNERDRVALG